MKKIIIMFIALAVVTGFSFASDPVEGFWLSIDEKTGEVTAGWHIYQERGVLYGKILSFSDKSEGEFAVNCKGNYPGFPVSGKVSDMPVAGTPWIYGLTSTKPGEWSGGTVVNPEDGRNYRCKIIFRPADGRRYLVDTLEMRGEIGLGIGRSQFWRKSDERTASSL
jgi:uncharacterized protein (DUF2147 family)